MDAPIKNEAAAQNSDSLLDHREFQKVLTRALVLPLTATLILAILIAWQVRSLAEMSAWVDHSEEVISQTHRVQNLLVEMETGLRGFALTGSPRFLEPYTKAKREFPSMIRRLEELLAYQPELREHALRVRAMANEWVVRFTDINLSQVRRGKKPFSLELGREMMDAMSAEIQYLILANHHEKESRLTRARRFSRLLSGGGAVFALFVGLLLALSSRRHILRISGLYQNALHIHDRLLEAQKEAVRTRDEFLSIASHELKTPLTSLKLQVQLVQKVISRTEQSVQLATSGSLRLAVRSVDRLAGLVDDMLDISRISAGRLVLSRENFDLSELAREVIERLEVHGNQAGCRLSLEAPEQLWGSWDRFRLDQVLTNLVTNATKYGAGSPVALRVQGDDQNVSIEIHDFGIGISKENQQRIFQKFERVQSSNSVSGMGLGLYIARELVEMHGGALEVESTLGMGSLFRVRLPRSDLGLLQPLGLTDLAEEPAHSIAEA